MLWVRETTVPLNMPNEQLASGIAMVGPRPRESSRGEACSEPHFELSNIVSRWLQRTPWMEQEVEKEDVGWHGEKDSLTYFALTVITTKVAIV